MTGEPIEQIQLTGSLAALLPTEEGWVLPDYGGLSVANLAAAMASMLGCDLPGALPALPEELWSDWVTGLKRVVLVVLDGLGYRLLERQQARGEGEPFTELAKAGRQIMLTSVFPSTTGAALLSMSSGRSPAEHAWLAYELYLSELGMLIDAILLCPAMTREPDMLLRWGVDPEGLVRIPMMAEALTACGHTTQAVLPAYFVGSGFTRMLYRGSGKLRGYRYSSDMWVQLRDALAETRGKTTLITAYWGGLDTLGHHYGPNSAEWESEFRSTSCLLAREFLASLPAVDREGTLLLVTADHGQIGIPPDQIVTADREADLMRHLQVPISGESRAAFVHPQPGSAKAIRRFLSELYPNWFTVLDSREALEAGLFGKPVDEKTFSRAGELLVLPRGSHALQRTEPAVRLLGRHGGLTPDEMLVPLVGARLDALDR